MASGPPGGAGGGVGEKHRWAESKVYTRKVLKRSFKSSPSSLRQSPSQQPPHPDPRELPKPPPLPPQDENPAPQAPVGAPEPPHSGNFAHAGCENGGRKQPLPPPPLVSVRVENGAVHRVIDLGSAAARSGPDLRELKRKLAEELEQVRRLIQRLESREQQKQQILALPVPPELPPPAPTVHIPLLHTSSMNLEPVGDMGAVAALRESQLERQLSVPLPVPTLHMPHGHLENNISMSENLEKEKRTPKANQYYRNPDFITGKDRFPPVDSHKKSKANGSKKGGVDGVAAGVDRFYAQAFKSCSALLTRLMKHKHGWVFNTPVDVKALGLYDYHQIIRYPMDLGTVKTRLNSNWYKSPREFAEDVRLTFNNAMTYNPKGQDVHIMAEQLLKMFEDKWPSIEAEFTMPPYLLVPKKLPPPPLDMRRILERSDSTAHQSLLESTPKPTSYTPHSTRTPALKKPKAKDVNKRDMTFEEKQKLSNNLQNLPSEKLDNVVQIIKKRNSTLSQHDDEIEVDIDSVDTETLWELDRFVTNFKKSLSKHKRKAELAIQAKQEAERNAQKLQNQTAAPVAQVPAEDKTDDKSADHASPVADKAKGADESLSSSSCSSSSDSGSSSSDSDSESSSS